MDRVRLRRLLAVRAVRVRTSIEDGNSITTDAAGYNYAALLSGVVALAALAAALWALPRLVLALLGAIVAISAFGLTIFVCGNYWLARLRGEVFFYGSGDFMAATRKVHPAIGPHFFAIAAVIGAIATLSLAISWLRQPRSM